MKNTFALLLLLGLASFPDTPGSRASPVSAGWEALKQPDRVVAVPQDTSLTITMPVPRIVYQRNRGKAVIPVRGRCAAEATSIEARLVSRAPGQGTTTPWVTIDTAPAQGFFSGKMSGQAGWYNLEVRAKSAASVLASAAVARVGIGEVFVVVGHSVAQGGEINLEGATDDRVNTVPIDEQSASFKTYLETGDPNDLPAPVFVKASTGVAPAPFGHGAYFWSIFAEKVAQQQNVPVLIYNAAFGGTSLEHWAKSSQNVPFEHSFVKSKIRMPYVNLLNTLKKYVPLTGVRALLADQGQNDAPATDENQVLLNYQTFVRQAREDLNDPELAVVVNRQTPQNSPNVRHVQDRMVKEPYCFPGPDYDTLAEEDRTDGIHLSASGMARAADMWAAALTPRFFRKATPYLPDAYH